MESYINISVETKKRISEMEGVFKKISEFDLAGCRSEMKRLEFELLETFDYIIDEFDDYLGGLEEFSVKGNTLNASFVCGGEGLDFLFQLFVFFGKNADSISATFNHDEEPDKSDISSIEHGKGKLFINGNEIYDEKDHQKNVFDYIRDEMLGALSEYSNCFLLITSTPDGEAPRWVRDQWIGLEIPLTIGSISGDLELADTDSEGPKDENESPLVMALDAFDVLQRKSPDAWAWWNENCTDLFHEDAAFVFSGGSWEIVERNSPKSS